MPIQREIAGDSTTQVARGNIKWERPHVPQARYLPLLRNGKLSRGAIYQDKDDPAVKEMPEGRPHGLQFLYNPTDVQVGYSIATSIYPTGAQPQATDTIIGVPGSTSVSFNLILDRTHDVWHDHSSHGIRHDVRQFERMVMYDDARPYVQPVAVHVIFGNPLLKFYGFIQGFNIIYSQWTQKMVPYRGAISGITLQTLPRAKTIGKARANALTLNEGPGSLADTIDSTGRDAADAFDKLFP